MLKSEQVRQKIAQSKLLRSLEDHAGWQILVEKLRIQEQQDCEALCSLGLDADKTEHLRYRINMCRWMLRSTQLDTPEQIAKWDQDLAFQQRMEKMRVDRGLPANLKDLTHEEEILQ